jgi:hypothetical protein
METVQTVNNLADAEDVPRRGLAAAAIFIRVPGVGPFRNI